MSFDLLEIEIGIGDKVRSEFGNSWIVDFSVSTRLLISCEVNYMVLYLLFIIGYLNLYSYLCLHLYLYFHLLHSRNS